MNPNEILKELQWHDTITVHFHNAYVKDQGCFMELKPEEKIPELDSNVEIISSPDILISRTLKICENKYSIA